MTTHMNSTLETIRTAGRAHKVVRILYTEKDGTSEGWRYVEPYSLSHDDGEYGLFAWDRSKDGIRRFSVTRIQHIEMTDEAFSPRYPIEL